MRGPPDEQPYTCRLPKKRLLIKPVPGDYHEGKQSIHHHHAGQSEDQKGDHIDDGLDQRQSLIPDSSAVLRSPRRQERQG